MLVESATRNGEPMSLPQLQSEVAEAWALLEAFRADPPPHPRPVTVVGLSMLWAGAGHAALGDRRGFATYSVVESVLLSSIALNVAINNPQPLPSLIALDLLFKGWSARETARVARRRQELALSIPLL